ncbi:hypothetical protein [Enterobacter pasteurii]|uniref:hypothetical protein n=1 Tax=Enterobacter pasteurii TaxID=3029761 RepID=UPI0021090001|nr:hypothetical protein [Enterobacter pasteurii]
MESLSKKCLQSPKTAQQLFGSLLSKAFQFPGENFVFLVNGRPVICFWGFVNLNESARDDVLDCLRESLIPEPAPVIIEEPEPEPEPEPAPVVTFEQADAPLIAQATAVRITEDDLYTPEPARVNVEPPEPAPALAQKKTSLTPLAAAGCCRRYRGHCRPLLWPKQAPTAAPAATPAQAPVAIAPAPVKTVKPLELTLPLHQAEVVEPKVKPRFPLRSRW